MHEPVSDLRRVLEELEFEWGLTELECDPHVLMALQGALRAGQWQVTVAVFRERKIVAIWPGYHETVLGMAFDIGFTTIAAHRIWQAAAFGVSRKNESDQLGEDLNASRVSYDDDPGAEQQMCEAV